MSSGKNKSFHNPFKNLKGLSVSASKKATPSKPKDPAPPEPQAMEDGELFALEMGRMGVEEVASRTFVLEPSSQESEACETPCVEASPPDDEDLFLSSLGKLDVQFKNSWHDEPDELEPATPRRMKLVRQGKLCPQARLDLHGLTRQEARDKVRFFLEDSHWNRLQVVLIVTGRGNHSGGKAVLRDETEAYLAGGGRAWVLEWARAPGNYGGSGALIVFLKEKSGR